MARFEVGERQASRRRAEVLRRAFSDTNFVYVQTPRQPIAPAFLLTIPRLSPSLAADPALRRLRAPPALQLA